MVPAIGMAAETFARVAPSFTQFASGLGKEWAEHA